MSFVDGAATLQIAIDATQADKARASLDGMAASSAKAETATKSLSATASDANTSVRSLLAQIEANTRATAENTSGMTRQVAAAKMVTQATNDNATALGHATSAHKAHGQAAYYNQLQMMEFAHVGRAFADSIAAGISPMRVLAFEGSRIIQAFQFGEGGLSGLLGRIGTAAGSMLTPLRLLGGLGAVITVPLVAGFVSAENQITRMQTALNGLGRESGLTVDNLRAVGTRAAAAGGLSTSSATDLATGFIGTGRIDAGLAERLTSFTRQYGQRTGQSTSDAGAELARAFTDPAKGADELEKKLGLLDDRTRESIVNMTAQGDVLGAQRVLFDTLVPRVNAMTDTTWSLSRAWTSVGTAVGDAVAAIGRFAQGSADPTLQQRLDAAVSYAARVGSGGAPDLPSEYVAPNGAARAFGAARAVSGGSPSARGSAGSTLADVASDAVDRLQRAVDIQERAALAAGRQAELDRRSLEVGDSVRAALPDAGRYQSLANRGASLQSALGLPGMLDKLGSSASEAQRALQNTNNQLEYFATATEKIAQDSALATQGILARTAGEKALLESQRAALDVMRSTGDATVAAATALARWNEAVAESDKRAEDNLRKANDAAALSGLLPFQRLVQENQFQTRDAGEQTVTGPAPVTQFFQPPVVPSAPAASAPRTMMDAAGRDAEALRLLMLGPSSIRKFPEPDDPGYNPYGVLTARPQSAQISATPDMGFRGPPAVPAPVKNSVTSAQNLQTGYNELAIIPIQQASRALDEQNRLLEVNAVNFNADTSVKATAAAKQMELNKLDAEGITQASLINAFHERGVEMWNALTSSIDAYSVKAGEAAKRTQDLQIAQSRVTDAMNDVRSTSKEALSTFIGDLRNGTSGAKALHDAIGKIEDKLFDLAENQVISSLFGSGVSGTSGGALGGWFSSLFSSLFGASGGAPMVLSAGGNVVTPFGAVPLTRYSGGGIARSAQLAMFGEGDKPEAYVPLPDGRSIPVTMQSVGRGGAGAGAVNVVVNNHNGSQVGTKASTGVDGTRQLEITLESVLTRNISSNGGVARTLQKSYGLGRVTGVRG